MLVKVLQRALTAANCHRLSTNPINVDLDLEFLLKEFRISVCYHPRGNKPGWEAFIRQHPAPQPYYIGATPFEVVARVIIEEVLGVDLNRVLKIPKRIGGLIPCKSKSG